MTGTSYADFVVAQTIFKQCSLRPPTDLSPYQRLDGLLLFVRSGSVIKGAALIKKLEEDTAQVRMAMLCYGAYDVYAHTLIGEVVKWGSGLDYKIMKTGNLQHDDMRGRLASLLPQYGFKGLAVSRSADGRCPYMECKL